MKHGVYGYDKGCRCQVCRGEKVAAVARWRARRRAGITQKLVPADEAKQHLQVLRDMGFSWRGLDKAAGTRETRRIGNGTTKWLEPRTADVILGLTVSDLLERGGLRSAADTFQQLSEIQAIGWSGRRIMREIGYRPCLRDGKQLKVRPATQAKVQALHDRLWCENEGDFRKVCRCHSLRVTDPEVIANRHAKRRERERKKVAA